MNPFLRQRRDGSFAAGYWVYLVAGLAVCAGISVLHLRSSIDGRERAAGHRKKSSDIAPITQPAALMSRVEVKNKPPPPETRSYRLAAVPSSPPSAAPSSTSPSFDPIDAALQAVPPSPATASNPRDPVRALDEGAAGLRRTMAAGYVELPPSLEGGATRATDGSQLLGYRDAAADGAASNGIHEIPGVESETAEAVVPRGTLVFAYLLTTVDTSNPAAVLQFAAARSLIFHHRLQLPFGTRFLGKLAGPPARDRLNLAIDTILFPEGLELPVSATAVEADEAGGNLRPGVAADYFPPPAWAQLAPYVSDFAAGYLGLLESRAQRPFAIGLGGAAISAASDSARPPLYEASAQAIQDFTQARLKDISQRYASYYLIPAGTACWLELEADLDLNTARSRRSPGSSRLSHR